VGADVDGSPFSLLLRGFCETECVETAREEGDLDEDLGGWTFTVTAEQNREGVLPCCWEFSLATVTGWIGWGMFPLYFASSSRRM